MPLQQVVTDAKDGGINVSMKLRATLSAKGRSSDFINGQEILALIHSTFKTTSNVEVLYTSMNLYQLEYQEDQGDKNLSLSLFFHTWDDPRWNETQ